MKEAAFAIKGVTCGELVSLLNGTWSAEEDFLLRTAGDFYPVQLELRFAPLSDNCRIVQVKVKSSGRRFWGETFVVCCLEGERLLLKVTRKRGVGRIGADNLGYRILGFLRSKLEFTVEEVSVF
uniref:Uncharacterized protein n=1 Tax=Thermofilum pendens TaxID=2269 RepID=A0A7C1P4W4_THEPE